MKILSISNMPLWLWGEGKGIPSVFFPQRQFARRGHGVHFLCPVEEGEARYSFIDGIHVHRFDFPFNFRMRAYIQTDTFAGRAKATLLHNLDWLFFQMASAFNALKMGLKIRPDIVYAHSLGSAFPAFLASRLLSAKLVIRVYGTGDLYWRRKKLWYRIRAFREHLSFKIPADYFIITNDGNYGDRLARESGVPEEKIRYWRNGINEEVYMEEPDARRELCGLLGITPSAKLIASTSRLVSYYYGVDKLIEALACLCKIVPETVCVMAGSGPDEDRLKALAACSGIAANIRFTGIVDRAMVKKILYASDIFVLLAANHNCTNTMWEAMASGRCIVTTETDAIKDVLASGESAVLVPHGKFNDLPRILERLLNDEAERKRLGENAKKRAKEVLEPWSKRAERELQLLERLISK